MADPRRIAWTDRPAPTVHVPTAGPGIPRGLAAPHALVVPAVASHPIPAPDPDAPSHRGVGPKGYARSDAHVRYAIEEALAADPTLDPSDVDVAVQNGRVTLTGSLAGQRACHAVVAIARAVAGSDAVTQSLTVRDR